MKVCKKIEDLKCDHCAYGEYGKDATGYDYIDCRYENRASSDAVYRKVSYWCGQGQWYCEFGDGCHEIAGRVLAFEYFMGKEFIDSTVCSGELEDSGLDCVEKSSILINDLKGLLKLFKAEDVESRIWNRPPVQGIDDVKSIIQLRIPPRSIFVTDNQIDFQVIADIERY
jgi:hypothetical protein